MKYKLQLTTEQGELLNTWEVCVNRAEMGEANYLHNRLAAHGLLDDIISEVESADLRAGIPVAGRISG